MDGASLSSGISVGGRAPPGRGKSGGGGTKSGAGTAAPAAAADALLALRDECQQAKLRERAAEDRARQ